jgi:ABC-type transporter Mla subunit MlaD
MKVRRQRPLVSNFAAGLIAVIIVGAVVYRVFGGSLPFTSSPFVLKAVFTTETELHVPSPVRIAGVDVGEVTSVQRLPGSPTASVVTMAINRNGLPIHGDATANILARLLLEGNFYVDLHPGSPSAPTLSSGGTLPAANTSGPVQFDRAISELDSAGRANLRALARGLGSALNGKPSAAQDASQDASVRGLTAAESLNSSLQYSADAFKDSAILDEALLGQQPHDLSNLVSGGERVFRALGSQQTRLPNLVATFDSVTTALASRQRDLSDTIGLLPSLLRSANGALGPLDASFAPARSFARDILPGVEQLDPTIGAGLPWLAQSTALLSPAEGGRLVSSLTPAIQQTASTLHSAKTLVDSAGALADCLIHNVIPTGNEVIRDPPVSTGLPVYRELFQASVGFAGASGNFDGNGHYVRASPAGGSDLVQTSAQPASGPLFGNAVLPPLATRPAWPGQPPPIRRGVKCSQNRPPNVNQVRTGAGP